MGLGISVMRFVLGLINILFLLAGLLMLIFGIIAKVDQQAIADIFSAILPSSSQEELDSIGVNISGIIVSNATFMIILGVIALVISVLGFFGACCMWRWMLVLYAIILIVLLLAEIALIIFAAVYTDKFKDEVQEGMLESLKEKYREGLRINGTQVILATGAVELAWDALQWKEKCCGAYNFSDYKQFEWNNTSEYLGIPVNGAYVPMSCCKRGAGATGDSPSSEVAFESLQNCLTTAGPEGKNEQNCYEALKEQIEDFIHQYKFIAIGIAIAICVIELVLIIFAFCLCYRVKDDKFV